MGNLKSANLTQNKVKIKTKHKSGADFLNRAAFQRFEAFN